MNSNSACLACSVFRRYLQQLRSDLDITYLDSSLHLNPDELCRQIDSKLAELSSSGKGVLLVFGDCHAHMIDQSQRDGVSRTDCRNCAELLLGQDEYRRLRREGAFILLREWAENWRQILLNIPGIGKVDVPAFMRDNHQKLAYLHVGAEDIPWQDLKECSQFLQLPFEIVDVSTDRLAASVEAALRDLDEGGVA